MITDSLKGSAARILGKIVITAGGTGGHVIPAITLCKALLLKGREVDLVHDERVAHIVSKHVEFPTTKINFFHKIVYFRRCIKALMVAINTFILLIGFLLKRPVMVIGFGGYVAAPALIAARVLKVPTVIIEQNSVMGRVNKKFANSAKFIITAFGKTTGIDYKKLGNKNIYNFGMFAPEELHNTKKETSAGDFRILITGGSQGSRDFSDKIPKALKALDDSIIRSCVLTFQSHKDFVVQTRETLSKMGFKSFEVADFFYDMPLKILNSDLVISRSGASTIGEICASGASAILIPYKHAKDNHQHHNAISLLEEKAAEVVLEDDKIVENLSAKILLLTKNKIERNKLAQNSSRLYDKKNIAKIVSIICTSV